MALASDAMYSPRIAATAASYVSSSVYYGYVPLCSTRDNERVVCDSADTAMETDEDDRSLPLSCHRLNSNNSRVIAADAPSTSRMLFHDGRHRRQDEAAQRNNRKRCNGDLMAGNQQKRFREGNAKDDGLAAVRYESAPLRLSGGKDSREDGRRNGCCWTAAGNRYSINDRHYKRSFSSTDYERMLFETHGCSAYQHHRHQVLAEDGCVETEF